MKRWFVVLLVLLAVIMLVSPGIVGRLAERNLENSIGWAEHESDDIVVTEQKFDRRWFTSEGQYRIEFRNGELQARITGPESPDDGIAPALIVDTHIDHGLIPITSMSRESGSLQPGLASAVSTLQFDPGDGDLVAIPGKLYSQVGLTGETASRFLLEAGTFDDESIEAKWSGADVTVTTDPSDFSMRFEGAIEPVTVEVKGDLVHVEKIRFKGDQADSGYGFGVGTFELEIEAVTFGVPDAKAGGIGKLTLEASSGIDGDRLNGRSVMSIADIAIPDFGDVDLAVDLALNRIDARTGRTIVKALQELRGSDDPQAALASIYPEIESELQSFLSAGAEIRIDRFDLVLPQGTVTSTLRFDLPQTDRTNFSWPSLLLALTASANVKVPAVLMDMAKAANPEAGSLIAMGILKKDGDFYAVNAKYAKGLLTVNGAPMPIPLPVQ